MLSLYSTFNVVKPPTFTTASQILGKKSNAKGFVDNTIIHLGSESLSPSRRSVGQQKNMIVVGGTEEEPVRIYVQSGMNTVEVVSGHVIIACMSSYGNAVHARIGSHVAIEASSNSKVTVTGDGDVTFQCDGDSNRLRDCTPGESIKVLAFA